MRGVDNACLEGSTVRKVEFVCREGLRLHTMRARANLPCGGFEPACLIAMLEGSKCVKAGLRDYSPGVRKVSNIFMEAISVQAIDGHY